MGNSSSLRLVFGTYWNQGNIERIVFTRPGSIPLIGVPLPAKAGCLRCQGGFKCGRDSLLRGVCCSEGRSRNALEALRWMEVLNGSVGLLFGLFLGGSHSPQWSLLGFGQYGHVIYNITTPRCVLGEPPFIWSHPKIPKAFIDSFAYIVLGKLFCCILVLIITPWDTMGII